MKSIEIHSGATHSVAVRRLRQRMRDRRGNTIVLVIGVLVLFVIVATAYVTRTQAGRGTAIAVSRSMQRDDNQQVVAESLAHAISGSLFAQPLQTPGFIFGNVTLGADWPRWPAAANDVRYSSDPQFPYNHAPYHVVPFTNWPDQQFYAADGTLITLDATRWPKGPGNPGATAGNFTPFLTGEDNPRGNPGQGDTRWLRDIEPQRWYPSGSGLPTFTHWRHMTNIARPDNAWRIAYNIADVREDSLIIDLNIPVEQWLTMRPDPSRFGINGDPIYPGPMDFVQQWSEWFESLETYQGIFIDPFRVPHNFYRLSDLNGNGILHEVGERPEDEFTPGTPRWNVSRVLADTDGDGYTDAFWFLAPTPIKDGIRQVVAISIIDNSAMLNANVATRFLRNDEGNPAELKKTGGRTPTDLALVSSLRNITVSDPTSPFSCWWNWNVGFYDNPDHHWFSAPGVSNDPEFRAYDVSLTSGTPPPWARHSMFTGLQVPTASLQYPTVAQRLEYWRDSGSHLVGADATSRYTPFGLSDEIELRMYHGNNMPSIFSRFEQSVQSVAQVAPFQFLRANVIYDEPSEYLDQRNNRGLVHDKRRMLTLFSGTRNDLMPPWLWQFLPGEDIDDTGPLQPGDFNGDGTVDDTDAEMGHFGMRKFDLRLGRQGWVMGRFNPAYNNYGFAFLNYESAPVNYNLKFGEALRDHLEMALMDRRHTANQRSYFGDDAQDLEDTRRLAAGFAANVTQARDSDHWSPLQETVAVSPPPGGSGATNVHFMGMEPQPFLVEAFIGHVYKKVDVPPTDEFGTPYDDAGHYLLLDPSSADQDRRSTVVVVQIANPYSVPIDLSNYRINVFGQPLNLAAAREVTSYLTVPPTHVPARTILEPATEEKPTTAIYYAIHPGLIVTPDLSQFGDTKWLNFLDIDFNDHPNATIIASANSPDGASTLWSMDREHYDESSNREIELRRLNPGSDPALPNSWVVIDRIDHPNDTDGFGENVRAMGSPGQRPWPDPSTMQPPVIPGDARWYHSEIGDPSSPDMDDIRLGPPSLGYKQWVQWVRVTRAWGVDINQNGWYEPNERSPRFVFADRALVYPGGTPVAGSPGTDGTSRMGPGRGGNRYKFDENPDADPLSQPHPNLPWFTRRYVTAQNIQVLDPHEYDPLGNTPQQFPRKPTFFDMNRQRDPAAQGAPCSFPDFPFGWSYPDKGWYSQASGTGSVDTPINNNLALAFPLHMTHKDADFEQVGELLNVWLFGHELEVLRTPVGPGVPDLIGYNNTRTTFSEFMSQMTTFNNAALVGAGTPRVNRLRVEPTNVTVGSSTGTLSAMIGVANATNINDPRLAIPALPAGLRVLDAMVCDGPGLDATAAGLGSFHNAKGFDGTATPGMININTAPPEVMRSLPHWYRLVHETGQTPQIPAVAGCPATGGFQMYNAAEQALVTNGANATALLPRTMIPEAIMHYREQFNGGSSPPNMTGIPLGPDYNGRREMFGAAQNEWMSAERGMKSIGEVMLLRQPGQAAVGYMQRPTANPTSDDYIFNQYWRFDLGVTPRFNDPYPHKPFYDSNNPSDRRQMPMRVSTSGAEAYDPFRSNVFNVPPLVEKRPSTTAGDVTDANALFAGASNIITTRSDTFTVYFRVRSFRQSPNGVWDATNSEAIVDDSRYVMLVDRSSVNRPGDKPRILYLEKLPN